MKNKKVTMKDRILNYMIENGDITSWDAIKEFGATRLSAIIFNLKKEGYNIKDEWLQSTNRYGDSVEYKRYFLEQEK